MATKRSSGIDLSIIGSLEGDEKSVTRAKSWLQKRAARTSAVTTHREVAKRSSPVRMKSTSV